MRMKYVDPTISIRQLGERDAILTSSDPTDTSGYTAAMQTTGMMGDVIITQLSTNKPVSITTVKVMDVIKFN